LAGLQFFVFFWVCLGGRFIAKYLKIMKIRKCTRFNRSGFFNISLINFREEGVWQEDMKYEFKVS
jgi:hypothetical protein